MTQTLLFPDSPKEVVKYYRTKLAPISRTELQAYQLASFQITKGKIKQYIEYNVKDTKDGLKCTKRVLWYVQVPNTHPRARKPNVFIYMDEDLRKKYHKKESSTVMDLNKGLKEIQTLSEKISPIQRRGLRAY